MQHSQPGDHQGDKRGEDLHGQWLTPQPAM
jgi:hypothetical protein